MNFRRKQPRAWPELVQDPQTQFMVGRLMGQVELAVLLLSQEQESDAAKLCAQSLAWAAAYFVEDEKYVERKAIAG